MKKLFLGLVGLALLAGCNTMAGIGEDTQALGKTVENVAERNHDYRP